MKRKVIFPIKDKYRFTNGGTYQDHLKDSFRKKYAGEDYRVVGRPTIGAPYYAIEDGIVKCGTELVTVEGKSYEGLFLNLVSTDGKVEHRQAHFSKLLVKSGSSVKMGDKIALMGASGYTLPRDPKTGGPSEAGAHVHITTLVEKKNVPPSEYIANPDAFVKEKNFKKGDNVLVKIRTKLRVGNGLAYREVAVASVGAVGRVVGEKSRQADGYTWYDVNFHNKQGWMIDNYLEKSYRRQTDIEGNPIKDKSAIDGSIMNSPKVPTPPQVPTPQKNTAPDTGTNLDNFDTTDILEGEKREDVLTLLERFMSKGLIERLFEALFEMLHDYKSRPFLLTVVFAGLMSAGVYEGIIPRTEGVVAITAVVGAYLVVHELGKFFGKRPE